MAHFIYVFSKTDCDYLIDMGYELLKFDNQKNIYIFENNEEIMNSAFSQHIPMMFSDILTFD